MSEIMEPEALQPGALHHAGEGQPEGVDCQAGEYVTGGTLIRAGLD